MTGRHINKAVGDNAWDSYHDFSQARYWVERLYQNKDDSSKTQAEEWWDKYELSKYSVPKFIKLREEGFKLFLVKARSWFD